MAPAQIPEAKKILRDAAWLPLQICFCFCQVALRQRRETTRQTGLFVLLLWACRLCGILLRSLGWPSHTHLLNHFLQTELYVICLDKIISTRVRLLNTQFDLCLHWIPLCSQSGCFSCSLLYTSYKILAVFKKQLTFHIICFITYTVCTFISVNH